MQSKIYCSDKDLMARYGVTRGTIWRWVAEGILPAPLRIGPNTTRWRAAEIEARDAEFESAKTAPGLWRRNKSKPAQ